MIQIHYGETAWGGKLTLSRQFFNPETKDYLHLEAHEIGAGKSPEAHLHDGDFMVACWVPDGNDGGAAFDGNLHHVVKSFAEFVPPAGFVEMTIPEECYC